MLRSALRRQRQEWRKRQGARAIRKAGFWFVDVPRTSSSSIKSELGSRFGPAFGKKNVLEADFATDQLIPDHVPAREMRDLLGAKDWDALYSFTFVRNPFDRVLSLYHYLQTVQQLPDTWSFSEFVQRLADADADTPIVGEPHVRLTTCDYVLDVDGTVLVDVIYRFEDRAAAVEKIGKRTGFRELGRLHLQRASPKGRAYRASYDDKDRDLVSRLYERDLALFNYEF